MGLPDPVPTVVTWPRTPGGTALVLAGGDPETLRGLPPPAHDVVIAADSGLDLAEQLGLAVDLAVGDFDSVSPGALERARARGVPEEAHPADKDASDLELALERALQAGCRGVVVMGLHGGRFDHELANVLLLAAPRFHSMRMEAVGGFGRLVVVHDEVELTAVPGDICTLLPLGGPARGVRTRGLRWTLDGDDLVPGSTRGLSNVFEDARATVSLVDGTLLAVLPGVAG